MPDKIQTTLRLTSENLSKITAISKKQKRSINSQIEFLVEQCISQYEAEFGKIVGEEFYE
ncbi:MAG: hypothetical protein LBM65_00405 [Oscillospiraceae bacterium]|jgi:hypothetical protein|nr:hypothetical protein [Oscillospiraceae bacterium]